MTKDDVYVTSNSSFLFCFITNLSLLFTLKVSCRQTVQTIRAAQLKAVMATRLTRSSRSTKLAKRLIAS